MPRTISAHGARLCVGLLLSAVALAVTAAPVPHRCSEAAVEQARRLLLFHFGPDDRIAIDRKSTRRAAPLRNPANRRQLLDVLEVRGHVHKGRYRMRFLYARMPDGCVLMGQEILEYASL